MKRGLLVLLLTVGCSHRFGETEDVVAPFPDATPEVFFDTRPPRDTRPQDDTFGGFDDDAESTEDTTVSDARPAATPPTTLCSFSRNWGVRASGNDILYAPADLAVDKAGNVYVAGAFHGKADFGFGTVGGPLDSVFAMKLDNTGKPLWARTWNATVELGVSNFFAYGAMALDPNGGLVLGGRVRGPLDLGSGPFPSTTFGFALVKLDADGRTQWSTRSKGATTGFFSGLAIDATGRVVVAGGIAGPMDFGLGPLPYVSDPSYASSAYEDAFVVQFDATGKPRWNHAYGDRWQQNVQDVTIAPGGDIVLFATGAGFLDFGGGALGLDGSSPGQSFLVRLDAEGRHVFSKSLATRGYPGQVTVAPDGDLVLVGNAMGTIALGGAALPGGYGVYGVSHGWFARYDANGTHRFSRRVESTAEDGLLGVTVLSDGSLLASGWLGDTTSMTGAPVTSAFNDAMLMRIGATGAVTRIDRYGDARAQHLHRTALAEDGKSFWMLGTFEGRIDLGAGPLEAAATSDLFLARCPL